MLLTELAKALGYHSPQPLPPLNITAIHEDSRRVTPGSLFIAKTGTKTDGAQFIADALAKGAVAIVCSAPLANISVPQIIVPDTALAASVLANALHGNPSHHLTAFGVTGTNGKTTTTYLIRHLIKTLLPTHRCGMIGTVEIDDGQTTRESEMTTPGAVELADLFGVMKKNGCTDIAMEVSSHALHQKRVGAIHFKSAGFCNLTGDHLDYHGTMEEYAASKAILFESLTADGLAVVNGEDDYTPRMIQNCKARVVRYGFNENNAYRATDTEVTSHGTNFTLHTPRGSARVSMELIGKHNIENALLAIALVGETYNISAADLASAISKAHGAPGRLQIVKATESQRVAVLVDYAHTDDALHNVLTALKPLTTGKLRVIFGCGGDRDRTKRPRMAKTAETIGDVIYITSDNPRTEDPARIFSDIQTGLSSSQTKLITLEPDRRKAIELAIRQAQPGDVVLIAGKGHENYQIIGTTKHHFDDVEEARRVLLSL